MLGESKLDHVSVIGHAEGNGPPEIDPFGRREPRAQVRWQGVNEDLGDGDVGGVLGNRANLELTDAEGSCKLGGVRFHDLEVKTSREADEVGATN